MLIFKSTHPLYMADWRTAIFKFLPCFSLWLCKFSLVNINLFYLFNFFVCFSSFCFFLFAEDFISLLSPSLSSLHFAIGFSAKLTAFTTEIIIYSYVTLQTMLLCLISRSSCSSKFNGKFLSLLLRTTQSFYLNNFPAYLTLDRFLITSSKNVCLALLENWVTVMKVLLFAISRLAVLLRL